MSGEVFDGADWRNWLSRYSEAEVREAVAAHVREVFGPSTVSVAKKRGIEVSRFDSLMARTVERWTPAVLQFLDERPEATLSSSVVAYACHRHVQREVAANILELRADPDFESNPQIQNALACEVDTQSGFYVEPDEARPLDEIIADFEVFLRDRDERQVGM